MPKPSDANDRQARLAAALRANLKRRKDQQRERSGPADGDAHTEDSGDDAPRVNDPSDTGRSGLAGH
ncbi:MAG TPA: hypothetical protein VEY95_10860 [Azospirillaceae bacterium]|nr:hypothetical protein [Azospirillaceae bacterium]